MNREPIAKRNNVTKRRIVELAVAMWFAVCLASCSSSGDQTQPPAQSPDISSMASMPITPAAADACKINAIKMCQEEGGAPAPPQAGGSYGPPNMPTAIEFQIPAGQTIKLMCYYEPQHNSVYRADATPEAALTQNSVEYMKKQGFCAD